MTFQRILRVTTKIEVEKTAGEATTHEIELVAPGVGRTAADGVIRVGVTEEESAVLDTGWHLTLALAPDLPDKPVFERTCVVRYRSQDADGYDIGIRIGDKVLRCRVSREDFGEMPIGTELTLYALYGSPMVSANA